MSYTHVIYELQYIYHLAACLLLLAVYVLRETCSRLTMRRRNAASPQPSHGASIFSGERGAWTPAQAVLIGHWDPQAYIQQLVY